MVFVDPVGRIQQQRAELRVGARNLHRRGDRVTTRVHRAARRRGSVAARGARAADAGDRKPQGLHLPAAFSPWPRGASLSIVTCVATTNEGEK